MNFTHEELNALKLIVDYHIIGAEGISTPEHVSMCREISRKLADSLQEDQSMLSADAQELVSILSTDDCMVGVPLEDLHGGALCRYPADGERAWLFHFKSAFVVLYDESNGHYSFCRELR